MDNSHFKNRQLSFKAMGLLSLMLSLPDNWKYSLQGLTSLAKDGVDSVRGGIKELEEHGYVVRSQTRNPDGTLGDIVFEIFEGGMSAHSAIKPPPLENPTAVPLLENPSAVKPISANPTLLITNKSITKELMTKGESSQLPTLTTYGEFQTVKLSADEHTALCERFSVDIVADYIQRVDTHQAKNNKSYKNHYATIIDWITQDQRKKGGQLYAINSTSFNGSQDNDPYKKFLESG